jgi:hypothetical protein
VNGTFASEFRNNVLFDAVHIFVHGWIVEQLHPPPRLAQRELMAKRTFLSRDIVGRILPFINVRVPMFSTSSSSFLAVVLIVLSGKDCRCQKHRDKKCN